MTPKVPDDEADDLPPAEAARARRRDHDAAAPERSGMRTGLAKQFKQVLDTQVNRARLTGHGAVPARSGEDDPTPDVAPERPAKKRGHPGDRAARPR